MFQEAKFTFTLVICQRIQIQFVIFPERDVKIFRSVYLGQQQNFFVYQIQITCDQKRFSRLSKGGHFSTTSGLVATCSRHALRKVCLQLGRERHSSRARPSPRATSSRRPPSSVLLRKVPIITNCALIKQKKAEITFLCDFCFLLFFCLQLIL